MKKRLMPIIGKLPTIYVSGKFKADRLLLILVSTAFTSSIMLGNILAFLGIINYNKTVLFLKTNLINKIY
jgi:hypothetical protein